MIADANQREYVTERPRITESNWRYRPKAVTDIVYLSILVGARRGKVGPFIDWLGLEAYNRRQCV
jgi:hypothetical protein